MYNFNVNLTVLIIAVYCVSELSTIKSTTLNVKQRVALLREKIENEIRENFDKIQPIDENTSFEDNEYDHDRALLTPLNSQKKKQKSTAKITSISTTVKTPAILAGEGPTPFSHAHSKIVTRDKIAKKISKEFNVFSIRKPIEIFYRRLLDESQMNTEVQWAHCQDLITPFLRGLKKELTSPNHLTPKSPVVRRFIHLMTLNTTQYTKEDIFSVLYQISNLQLRLFQWDFHSINLLFNVLMKEKKHTFSNLKWGIRKHFEEWRLDISNLTNLLHQTRLFRPPCIKISHTTGSTKSNKVSSYPKKVTPINYCDSSEDASCKYKRS